MVEEKKRTRKEMCESMTEKEAEKGERDTLSQAERRRETEGRTIAALHPCQRDFVSIDSTILHVFCAV